MQPDTIAAPITAPGRAAVAVVRISGPGTVDALTRLVPQHRTILEQPRRLHLVTVLDIWEAGDIDPEPEACSDREAYSAAPDSELVTGYRYPGPEKSDDPVLDVGLVAFFPSPKSFTGEDCVEFHLHGSPFLVGRLLENLGTLGIRLANPGEFTERAYLNGQVDLSQAEAVADIIAAQTSAQARLAQQQLEGRLSKAIHELGEPLRDLLAEIEAYIDFPDEGIDPIARSSWHKVIRSVRLVMRSYIDSYSTGRLYREGVHITLAGPPNAGKSSLLNAFCNDDRAIVTPIPGTTRDSIETRVTLGGLEVSFWDTAGILDELEGSREIDEVESLGVERSWKHVKNADLVLCVLTAEDDPVAQKALTRKIAEDAKRLILVLNKVDLLDEPQCVAHCLALLEEETWPLATVSALTREGIDALAELLVSELVGSEDVSGSLLITNQRHHESLTAAERALAGADAALAGSELAPEFVALDLRSALGALQDIIGVTHSEDILGRIFFEVLYWKVE